MVHKSQICFNGKLNMLLYMHSVLVSMFIMFPIIKLRNYMVPGQNKPKTLNYYYMYIMIFPSLLLVSKNHETL